MYKIAISGKANSGKDTVARLFAKVSEEDLKYITFASLAEPIKKIAKIMFPKTKRKVLFGPSKNRSEIIPGAFKDNVPLTYRQLLQDLGTDIGRSYKEDIWLDILDYKCEKAQKHNSKMFIVADVRFRNEFDRLKNNKYIMIRVIRNSVSNMNHLSEIEQDSIKNNEFDYIINNNSSLDALENRVLGIFNELCSE